ncbi:MAG: protein kinase [Planctomycetes bacterium]|nr:protein kinase [Planctomycetota bacterium]
MSNSRTCADCGKEFPANSPGELCPACLMRAGLRDVTTSFHPEGSQPEQTGDVANQPVPSTSMKQLAAGEEFGGYKIVRRLGRGGMGVVYEADQTETGRRVALKILARSLDNTEARKRFLREGRLAASINHPNSVYVFGTDEVEDVPIISMELVRGGTLAEQVAKNGPLPVSRAVDAILQVIDGLEAAREKGVLHRDVKPANCFIEPDGTVKIGDFGLSISTGPRDDISRTELTFAGQVLGTPAFASPEQLRGDELDIRSDIYSVAVTLFYLLTGDTPFRGKNFVQLLATVLEQPAPRADQLRPDIPKGLANVLARCLHKLPEQRYRDYESLRQELLPFSTTAPTPALLGLRTLASIIDMTLLSMCMTPFTVFVHPGIIGPEEIQALETNPFIISSFVTVSLTILYYGTSESHWGTSIGKSLLRLRVVDAGGSNPSFGRALARAAFFVVWPSMFSITHALVFAGASFNDLSVAPSMIFTMLLGPAYVIMFFTMFSTARRTNGYAGLHDRIGGVTVVSRQRDEGRQAWSVDDVPLPQLEALPTIGPFAVLDTLVQNDDSKLVLAYDTRLLRRVWIHRRTQNNLQPVSESIRNISRPGRLRWLANGVEGDDVWDAYEAPRGEAIADAMQGDPDWSSIRYWLSDLAEELKMSGADSTLPKRLALDRLWIGSDGRLKLLDIAAPVTSKPVSEVSPRLTSSEYDQPCIKFIAEVAHAMTVPKKRRGRRSPLLIPLSARDTIDKLANLTSLETTGHRLRELLEGVPSVSRKKRFALMFCCIAASLSTAATLAMTGFVINRQTTEQVLSPEVYELKSAVTLLEAHKVIPNSTKTTEQIRTWIAGHHRTTIQDPNTWSNAFTLSLPPRSRQRLERLAKRPAPTEEALLEADAVVQPIIEQMAAANQSPIAVFARGTTTGVYSLGAIPGMMALVWFEFVWFPSLFAALFFKGGLLLRMFNVVAVRRDGKRASGLRMFWRAMVPAPIALALASVGMAQMDGGHAFPTLTPVASWGAVLLVGVLLVVSVLHPRRSISDRLAGTYLVPR